MSDWFTKILIGAGLVELKEASYMANGIRTTCEPISKIDAPTIICAAIILFWSSLGIYMRLSCNEACFD